MASPMITSGVETSLKRKRVKTVYDVLPVNAPEGYVPWWNETLEAAEYDKNSLEKHYRNHFTMTLDWDESDPDKHISVKFTYPPSYLFNFKITPYDV